MDVSNPLVSVIVPAYDREPFVGQAIASIVRQDYRPLEVVVADDGSTDGTADVAGSFPGVRVLRLPHGGVAAARNAAIAASSGTLLAFLDSDDLWLPGKLTAQVAYLRANPEIGYCFTRMRNFLEPGHGLPGWIDIAEMTRVMFGHSLCSMLIRREVFDRVGGFDTRFDVGEDTDWFFRAKYERIPFAALPRVFVHRRVHDANITRERGPEFPIHVKIARAHLERTRPRDPERSSA
jgi:glycosyltransferase involved in cell wall biosynthesis